MAKVIIVFLVSLIGLEIFYLCTQIKLHERVLSAKYQS